MKSIQPDSSVTVESDHGDEGNVGIYQELRPARAGTPGRGIDTILFKIFQTVEGATAMPSPASSPAIRRSPMLLSAAMRSTRRTTRRWVGGRPGLFGFDLAAQRRGRYRGASAGSCRGNEQVQRAVVSEG